MIPLESLELIQLYLEMSLNIDSAVGHLEHDFPQVIKYLPPKKVAKEVLAIDGKPFHMDIHSRYLTLIQGLTLPPIVCSVPSHLPLPTYASGRSTSAASM